MKVENSSSSAVEDLILVFGTSCLLCFAEACEQGPAEENTKEHREDAGVNRAQDLTMRELVLIVSRRPQVEKSWVKIAGIIQLVFAASRELIQLIAQISM